MNLRWCTARGVGTQRHAGAELEPRWAPVEVAEQPRLLARHVAPAVDRAPADRTPEQRVVPVNQLVEVAEHAPGETFRAAGVVAS